MAVLNLATAISGVAFHDGLNTLVENLINDGFVFTWVDRFVVANHTGQKWIGKKVPETRAGKLGASFSNTLSVGMTFVPPAPAAEFLNDG